MRARASEFGAASTGTIRLARHRDARIGEFRADGVGVVIFVGEQRLDPVGQHPEQRSGGGVTLDGGGERAVTIQRQYYQNPLFHLP